MKNITEGRNVKLVERKEVGIEPALPKEYEPLISLTIMIGAVFIISYLLISSGFFG